jgi:hypothetical protein
MPNEYKQFFKVFTTNKVMKGDKVLHEMLGVSGMAEKFTKDQARQKMNWELARAIEGEYSTSIVHENKSGGDGFNITFSRGDGLVYITDISIIEFREQV